MILSANNNGLKSIIYIFIFKKLKRKEKIELKISQRKEIIKGRIQSFLKLILHGIGVLLDL